MDSRIIKLTPAAFKYGNLNISSCGRDFFPPDAFGGSSKKASIGVPIILEVDGLPNCIKTDIPKDTETGNPRWIFRERKWVKDFVRLHKLQPNDTITIYRLDTRKYRLTHNNHDSKKIDYVNRVFFKDARTMAELPNESIHLIVTSPPYFNVKDYSLDGWQKRKTGDSIKVNLAI